MPLDTRSGDGRTSNREAAVIPASALRRSTMSAGFSRGTAKAWPGATGAQICNEDMNPLSEFQGTARRGEPLRKSAFTTFAFYSLSILRLNGGVVKAWKSEILP